MESEEDFRIDICVECKVTDGDSSEKKVFKCALCERWFCEKHIEPRLAFIRDYDAITRYPELRVMLDNEWKRQDGHPDFAYTRIKFLELDIEEKNRNELIKQALDRMNHYYDDALPEKTIDTKKDREKRVETLLKEEEEIDKSTRAAQTIGICPKCHSVSDRMLDYDVRTMLFKCKKCGFKYGQLRAYPHNYVDIGHSARKMEIKEKPSIKKPFPVKKVIGLSLVIVIVGVFLWYAPTIISTIQNYFSQSSYTKVTVVAGQISTVKFDDNEYYFLYQSPPWVSGNQFSVSTPTFSAKLYPAVQGATYRDFGIEIKVSEVHSDYIVLLVKPTY